MADAIITRRGGSQGESKPLNLPISIQLTQPTPVRVGHLWVKADIASQITNVVIDRALKANIAEGTLQLVVQLDPHKLVIAQNISISNDKDVPVTMMTTYSASKWKLSDLTADENTIQMILDGYPVVYSKLNGVLNVETAYIWDGTTWKPCSQKGHYITNGGTKIYNHLGDGVVTLSFDFAQGRSFPDDGTSNWRGMWTNATGEVVVNTYSYHGGGEIWRRNGDVFNQVNSGLLGNGLISNLTVKISDDGMYIVAFDRHNWTIEVLKWNGTTYVSLTTITIPDKTAISIDQAQWLFSANEDCSLIYVRNPETTHKISVVRRKLDGTYERVGGITGYPTNLGIQGTLLFARGTNLYMLAKTGTVHYVIRYNMADISKLPTPPSETIWTTDVLGVHNADSRIYVTRDEKYLFASSQSTSDNTIYNRINYGHIPTKTKGSIDLGTSYKCPSVMGASMDGMELLLTTGTVGFLIKLQDNGTTLTKLSQTALAIPEQTSLTHLSKQYIPH